MTVININCHCMMPEKPAPLVPGSHFESFTHNQDPKMKNNFAVFGLIAGLGLLVANSAQAELAITGDIGTTGLGLHLSLPVQPNLNARIGFGYLNHSYTGSTDTVDYDFKLKLKTMDALLDWFPTGGQFRVSGGIVYNGNKIDAAGKSNSNGTYTLNGRTYTAADAGRLDGKIDFRKAVPYLGIGWGNAVAKDKGWGMSSDFGVLFQGSPNTSLTNSGCTAGQATCARLATDVAAENVKLADEVSSFKAYPVLRVGISRKF
jgi:hypothetical protein